MKKISILILGLVLSIFQANSQEFGATLMSKLSISNLGRQTDLGFGYNWGLFFTNKNYLITLNFIRNEEFDCTNSLEFKQNSFHLIYNFKRSFDNFYNYLGLGANFSLLETYNKNLLSKDQLYGVSLNFGFGAKIYKITMQIGSLSSLEFGNTKRIGTMFYISLNAPIYSWKK